MNKADIIEELTVIEGFQGKGESEEAAVFQGRKGIEGDGERLRRMPDV
jgi:hypothetical protein